MQCISTHAGETPKWASNAKFNTYIQCMCGKVKVSLCNPLKYVVGGWRKGASHPSIYWWVEVLSPVDLPTTEGAEEAWILKTASWKEHDTEKNVAPHQSDVCACEMCGFTWKKVEERSLPPMVEPVTHQKMVGRQGRRIWLRFGDRLRPSPRPSHDQARDRPCWNWPL